MGKAPWGRKWPSTPGFLPGKSHAQRSLEGYIVHGVAKRQTWLNTQVLMLIVISTYKTSSFDFTREQPLFYKYYPGPFFLARQFRSLGPDCQCGHSLSFIS